MHGFIHIDTSKLAADAIQLLTDWLSNFDHSPVHVHPATCSEACMPIGRWLPGSS